MSKSNPDKQQRAREKIAQIRLMVGTPLIAPEQITWPSGL